MNSWPIFWSTDIWPSRPSTLTWGCVVGVGGGGGLSEGIPTGGGVGDGAGDSELMGVTGAVLEPHAATSSAVSSTSTQRVISDLAWG